MPISNYVNPGVYVTQGPAVNVATNPNNPLNVCFLGYAPNGVPQSSAADVYQVTSTSGVQTFALSASGFVSSTLNVTNNVTGTVLVSGVDYGSIVTSGGVTQFSTISGANTTQGTWLRATYSGTAAVTGTVYTFKSFNDVQTLFGSAFTYDQTGTATVNSPNTLAAYLAFQNGATTVSCVNISGSTGSNSEFLAAVQSLQFVDGIDVIVPLKYDTGYNTGSTGSLFEGVSNFVSAQANNGVYQRAFIGMDSTVGGNLFSVCSKITSDPSVINQRVTLVAPNVLTFNPGLNTATGVNTGTVSIDGIYLAAAVAGLFAGQPTVATPITNKVVTGFAGIPNQISTAQSNTLQSYGVTVARQNKNGQIVIRHGLTTDTSNWLTQEISINAIGDRLANIVENSVTNSGVIGSPMTNTTIVSLLGIIEKSILNAKNQGLIQAYQNLSYTIDQNNPTAVDVTFQYSPTYPLNYVNIVFNINAATGQITAI